VPILATRVLALAVYLGQQADPPPSWLRAVTTVAVVQAFLVGLATLALVVGAARVMRRLPAGAATASQGPRAA
jgi:hypothetical protein